MTDQGQRPPPGGGTFGKFFFNNNNGSGTQKMVKWVPKGTTSALAVNPDPVPVWQTGTSSPSQLGDINECDVYYSPTGDANTWTKYHCTLPANYPYISFQLTNSGEIRVDGGNSESGPWHQGALGTPTDGTTPPA